MSKYWVEITFTKVIEAETEDDAEGIGWSYYAHQSGEDDYDAPDSVSAKKMSDPRDE